MDWIHLEGPVYWGLMVGVFLTVAIWESFLPRRKLSLSAERRWSRHGVMLVLTFAVMTLVLRISPVAAAALSVNRAGILSSSAVPLTIRFAVTVLLLDLLQYGVHWCFHHVRFLWRIHEVHHSDPDFDVSTAARFHPLDALFTQGVVLAAIVLLSPPVSAVFVAEMLKVMLNFLEHANASLPEGLEKTIRLVLVTPDLHRIHHSEDEREQSGNLGQIFPWWDRLLGTYVGRAAADGEEFATGLKGFQNAASIGVGFMLGEPFRRPAEKQKGPAVRPGPST
jgi:sterol desaturase/sphingolipid hydroxylase (fatty acid hydroxylase superfamily)